MSEFKRMLNGKCSNCGFDGMRGAAEYAAHDCIYELQLLSEVLELKLSDMKTTVETQAAEYKRLADQTALCVKDRDEARAALDRAHKVFGHESDQRAIEALKIEVLRKALELCESNDASFCYKCGWYGKCPVAGEFSGNVACPKCKDIDSWLYGKDAHGRIARAVLKQE